MPVCCITLCKEKDMALVERKIMVMHVVDAVKLFLAANTDVNMLSVAGVYILQCMCT